MIEQPLQCQKLGPYRGCNVPLLPSMESTPKASPMCGANRQFQDKSAKSRHNYTAAHRISMKLDKLIWIVKECQIDPSKSEVKLLETHISTCGKAVQHLCQAAD